MPPVMYATLPFMPPPSPRVGAGRVAAPGPGSTLHAQSNAHAAADAQAGDALLRVAPAHLVQQGDEDAAAGSADRMADRDRPAVDVDLARVPAHLVVDGAGLGREGLVDLEEVE